MQSTFKVKKNNADFIFYMLTLLVSMQQGNVKKFEKLIKIVETVEENPNIF